MGMAAAGVVAAGMYFISHQRNKNALDKASDRFEQVSREGGPVGGGGHNTPGFGAHTHTRAPSAPLLQGRLDVRQRAGDNSASTSASKAYYDAKEKARN